jgi:hypothetical protein
MDNNLKKKKSKKPYVLKIKKIKNNKFLKEEDLFESKKEFSPLSGSEYPYDPDKWNKIYNIKETHNCYSYALGKIVKGLKSKSQPGYASGFNYFNDKDFDCNEFKERFKKDSPASYIEKFDNACIPGFYKIFLAIDPPNDYHWWRQDADGYFSHKPGSTKVLNLDASGKLIKNPYKSNRKFEHRNYYKPCFFACIYSDLSRSIDNIYNI